MAKRSSAYLQAFAGRLNAAMDALGLSQAGLARELAKGTSSTARELSSAISRWCSGDSVPDPETLPRLAEVLGVTLDHLLRPALDQGNEPTKAASATHDDGQLVIPRLLKIAAGAAVYSPLDGKNNLVMERRMVEKLVGPVPAADPARVVFAADVRGDSMAPLMTEGDILLVQKFYPVRAPGRPLIESGKIYVLNLNAIEDEHNEWTQASVKRLSMGKGHELTILSDNPTYPPRVVDMRRVRLIQEFILGRAVNLIRAL